MGALFVKKKFEKKVSMPKKVKGGLFGDFFRKKSHRAENTLREPLPNFVRFCAIIYKFAKNSKIRL